MADITDLRLAIVSAQVRCNCAALALGMAQNAVNQAKDQLGWAEAELADAKLELTQARAAYIAHVHPLPEK